MTYPSVVDGQLKWIQGSNEDAEALGEVIKRLTGQRDRLREEIRELAKLVWTYPVSDEMLESSPFHIQPGDMTEVRT